MKSVGIWVASVAAVALLLFAGQNAQARPGYNKAFQARYSENKAAKAQKCNACHYGKKKTNRNNYGVELGKKTGKNQKDATKISDAFTAVEDLKSAVDGKTFGDLLKAGEVPSEGWKAPE